MYLKNDIGKINYTNLGIYILVYTVFLVTICLYGI